MAQLASYTISSRVSIWRDLRQGVGPTQFFYTQDDALKGPRFFGLSRAFSPLIFHFKEFQEQGLALFHLGRSALIIASGLQHCFPAAVLY